MQAAWLSSCDRQRHVLPSSPVSPNKGTLFFPWNELCNDFPLKGLWMVYLHSLCFHNGLLPM